GRKRRALDRRRVQRGRTVNRRTLSDDVILGGRQVRLQTRDAHRGRQITKVNVVSRSAQVKGKRAPLCRRDDESACGCGPTVCGGTTIQRDLRPANPCHELDVARFVTSGNNMRSSERQRAAYSFANWSARGC